MERHPGGDMRQEGLTPIPPAKQAKGRGRLRLVAGTVTVALHMMVVAALLWLNSAASPPPAPDRPPLLVSLVQPKPLLLPPPEVTLMVPVSPALPALPRLVVSAAVVSVTASASDTSDILSDAQLAGAAIPGAGGGSGCDLAREVQQALRRDAMVRAAVVDAHRLGKAILLWNGDWVRAGGQDGKGLSAVREAITWEVAFAPAACRNVRMHGLVLLSLADGGTRFAVGANEWRWSDLLGVR